MCLFTLMSIALAGTVVIEVEGSDAVRVRAASGSVHLPACRGVMWERFVSENEGFEAISGPTCGRAEPALKVGQDGHLFPFDGVLPPPPETGLFVVRPVVVVGEKCRENQPFWLAGCAVVRREFGPNLVIRPGG